MWGIIESLPCIFFIHVSFLRLVVNVHFSSFYSLLSTNQCTNEYLHVVSFFILLFSTCFPLHSCSMV
ncbi:hypothetical protein EV702DRAFT_1089655 [Suillus placidus]|uniref:Uncharacterized protein n=1 Tax=Suillus placidus TaxID=48579 RepID=A0A9P7D4D6_9AGAM|nr:hypothetical protein EV702DRAFT_1089655 [Suillus placidus]